MDDKRLEQKKETWIKNVMNVQDKTREEAEALYDKIQPFKVTVEINQWGRTIIKEGDIVIGEQG